MSKDHPIKQATLSNQFKGEGLNPQGRTEVSIPHPFGKSW